MADPVVIKSSREIELMRVAGQVVAKVFSELEKECRPGVSTLYLSRKGEEIIREAGCTPTFKGYGGFPEALCVSVNDTLIHGIPTSSIILKDGDIVSLDVGATYQGYCCDACRTFPVGICNEKALALIKDTEDSFWYSIEGLKEGTQLGTICHRVQEYCEKRHYSLPREYTGHGCGTTLHEGPAIPNYGTANTGLMLKNGMTICIEPMVCQGKPKLRTLSDGWTTKTKDGKLSAHYENTVLVTKDGYEVLTIPKEDR